MKKFFEKHDLIKMAGIMVIIAVIFSWILKYCYFSSGSLIIAGTSGNNVVDGSTAGIYDMNTYSILGLYYFTNIFVYILVVFGFYKFLGTLDSYQALTDKIAKKFKGKEKIFVAISLAIYAFLASIFSNAFALIVFVPFTISIAKKLHLDKITSLISSFGGILLGTLCSTYGTGVAGILTDSSNGLGVTYGYAMLPTIVIGIIGYIILLALTFNRINDDSNEEVSDLLTEKEEKVVTKKMSKRLKRKKENVVPILVVLIIMCALFILGYVDWSTSFGFTGFTNLHTSLSEATLESSPLNAILFALLGSTTLPAFGSWDLFTGASTLIILSFIIAFIYNTKLDDMISSFGEGVKDSIKSCGILLIVYAVLVLSVSYPTIPGIINQLDLLLDNTILKPFGWLLNSFITSAFTIDFTYTVSLIGSLFAKFSNLNAAALALQAGYGLFCFLCPTSVVLVLGLSTLDIKFKDYFKFIWKFLLALLIVILIVLYILIYV